MAEGGDQPWSSHRRQQNEEVATEDDEEAIHVNVDVLRRMFGDELPTDEEASSKNSVACNCSSDFPESSRLTNSRSCPDLSDLDPEVRRRSLSFSWLVRKVTRRRSTKSRRGNSVDENRTNDRDENGRGYYGRCLQEAKRVRETAAQQNSYGRCLQEAKRIRETAELEARNRRMRRSQRRPHSLVLRAGHNEEREDSRTRRWSFFERFRRVFEDSSLEHDASVIEERVSVPSPPIPPVPHPRERNSCSSMRFPISLEEFEKLRRDRARLRAEHIRMEYYLINDILSVTNCQWYWGKINRYQAEKVLEGYPDGTFILRDSAQYHYLFSVSFRRYSRTYHARIEQWKHRYSFDKPSDYSYYSTSVCQLLAHYSRAEQCMYYEPLLLKPLRRKEPASLQHMCRAIICSRTTFKGVEELPLPPAFKTFLKEYHYKVPVKKTEDKGTQTPAPRRRFSLAFHRE